MEVQDADHGRREDEQDDEEGGERPSKVGPVVEELGDDGAGEGGAEVGGRVDGEDDHPVTQGGDVGDEDLDNEAERDVADPVEDLGGRVGLDVLAGGLHDHADGDEEERADKALHAAPDVDDLADAEGHDTADDASSDADDGKEAVFLERTRDVRAQGALDGAEHRGNETNKP